MLKDNSAAGSGTASQTDVTSDFGATGNGQGQSSFDVLRTVAPGGISKQSTGEVLSKAKVAFSKAIAALPINPKEYDVNIIDVSNSLVSNLYLSSIIVTVNRVGSKQRSWTVALLEGSNVPYPPKPAGINGTQILIDNPSSVVYDEKYQQTIGSILKTSFPGDKMLSCNAQVIPSEFNFDDEHAVKTLIINMLMPLFTEVDSKVPGFSDLNLKGLSSNVGFGVSIAFGDSLLTDPCGLPVRNDLSITLSASDKNKGNAPNSLNNNNRPIPFSRANGFIDLVWAGKAERYNPYMQQMLQEPKFSARLIITSLTCETLISLPAQLLALTSTLALAEGTTWFPAFKPKPVVGKGNKAVDIRNIGAANYEGNVLGQKDKPQIIDTKAATFDDEALGNFITKVIRPGLIISMDVSDCGADSAANEAFLAASNGSSNAQQAIIEAANTLTGGAFSRHYNQSSEPPVLMSNEKIQLGSYTDSNGHLRDIRDIDYLAMANILGDNNIKALTDWTQTFTNLQYPIELRLDARRKMIQNVITGSNIKLSGFARRITFSNQFLSSLLKACAEVGTNIRLENTGMGQNFVTQRAAFEYADQATMLGAGNGVFGRSSGVFGQNANYQSNPAAYRY